MADPFDLERLRVNPADLQPQLKSKPLSQKWRRQFVQVPWEWVPCLRTRSGNTYHLALVLLYAFWRTGGQPVVLSNGFAYAEGLSRRSKWRALAELQELGLVRVERAPRKSPRVTPLFTSPSLRTNLGT
jgi:hypothetical protein